MSYREIAALQERGEAAALCVVVSTAGTTPRKVGTKMIVHLDGGISGTIGGGELERFVISEALGAIREGAPRLVEYPKSDMNQEDEDDRRIEVFIEPILPQATILVIGLGHVGKAVARLAKFLGFHVVVSDDREGFASPEQIPQADRYHTGAVSQLLETFEIHPQTYVVMTTRNVEVDVAALPSLLRTPAVYIGVIGSKTRWENTKKQLLTEDITEKALKRVVSPIGIEIKAETPEEIALSIMAEIVMRHKDGEGGKSIG